MGYSNKQGSILRQVDGGGAVACSTEAPLAAYRLFRTARRSRRDHAHP
jgi:hypothetical protein